MRGRWLAATGVAVTAEFASLAVLARANDSPVVLSSVTWLLGFAVIAAVGAVILDGAPRNPVGAAFVVAGLGTPAASLLEEVSLATGSVWCHVLSLGLFGTAWLVATTIPLLYLPDGRLPSARWGWAPRLALALIAVLWTAVLTSPRPVDGGDVVSPWAVPALAGVPAAATNVVLLAGAVLTVAGASSVVVRWRRADGVTRSRLSWVALAALVVVLLTVATWLLPDVPDAVGAVAETVQVVVLPVATGIAITRHRLFDITLVLRRSLVYTVLAGLVALTYVAGLVVFTRLASESVGYGASVVAGASVAVALMPVRDRLDRRLSRWLYGDRDTGVLLAGLRAGQGGTEEVMASATAAIAAALKVDEVSIDTADDPARRDGSTAIPLVALGRREGTLLVGRRSDGSRLDRHDRRLLDDLAVQVALLARAVRLGSDVQSSRERLVAAREAERLRLRRDLHDGVGPILAGLTLQVEALGDKVSDPGGLELAERIKVEMRGAIEALRSAVDGLRPSDLDQLGLAASLEGRAAALSVGGVAVTVDCPRDLDLGPASEVAAYRVACEAMANVLRHAGATRCAVRIRPEGHQVVVAVEDDGVGMPTTVESDGVGLGSIRDRAEELGGSWRVAPAPGGGTSVEVRLPVGEAR